LLVFLGRFFFLLFGSAVFSNFVVYVRAPYLLGRESFAHELEKRAIIRFSLVES